MKKLYFLLLTLLLSTSAFAQVIITEIADPNNDATARYVELYNVGSTAQDLTGWELRRWTNANTDAQTSGIDLTSIGMLDPGEFAIIAANGTAFETVYGFPADISAGTGGAADSNGDDKIALRDASMAIIDIYGVIGVSSNNSNSADNFEDGRAERVATVLAPNATWTSSEWDTDNDQGFGAGAQDAPAGFDPGAWIGESNACGVSLGGVNYACSTNTIGDNNDGVTISIAYTGLDAGITSVSSTNPSATVGGDDPSSVTNGTIIITGLIEGDVWDITLNGGDCDTNSLSDTVPASQCDPTPNTCFDLSTGTELFESVAVTTNSNATEWTESSGTYSMNGFCGGGCTDASDTWLIFGPLNMTMVTDLSLLLDATEGFDGTELNIQYTADYSSLCPDSTIWTSAQVIADTGSYNIDLSAASGTDVFIGVQYLESDGTTSSSWSLSNVSLAAFGTCPTLGARPTSDCATCDVILQSASYTCASNTSGDNNDAVTVNIPYTGSENTIVSVTSTAGTLGGDDPALTANGTITISGLSEGDAWSITLNGGDCDGTMLSGMVASAQCDPVFLVINEINADPDATNGDANGDGSVNTSEDEFIELYNTGTTSIDLTDYTISDAAQLRHTFPAGSILPTNSFITIFGGGTPTGITGLVQTASSGSVGLNNGSDTITITNNNGVDVLVESYSGAGNNQSIAREPDFTGAFVDHSTIMANGGALFSPGQENDDTTLSSTNLEATNFSMYPNPTDTGFVTILSSNTHAIKVQVFDILGKQVKNETLTNNTLNVSNLNTGIYIVKIAQNNALITKKLVIK
jgi:hypothetical protein